jgi:hypothetical protein
VKTDAHLSPEEFIDAAEGVRTDASLPHLAECLQCRRELADLRRTMTVAVDADVPEPSPLYWDTLVRAHRRTHRRRAGPVVVAGVDSAAACSSRCRAAALLVLIVAIAPSWRGARVSPPVGSGPTAAAVEPSNDNLDLAADPLLTLVSDLSANMDLDSVSASGFADPDSAEHASRT